MSLFKMMTIILFFSLIFPEVPPGFYRVSMENGEMVHTPISTTISAGSRVLHNGQDITAWDFRETTVPSKQIRTVLDQRYCGACWAFASNDVSGAAMFLNSLESSEKIDTVMSPQYLLNCMNGGYDGCQGGYPWSTMLYIMQGGIAELDCVPYEAKANECVDNCTNKSVVFKKFVDKTFDTYKAAGITDLAFLRQLVVTSGPVVASISVYSDFDDYTGGVYELDPNYPNSKFRGFHAVAIYGFGVEDDKNYWLVKNSWGESWGDKGYIKIRMGTNEVGIEDEFIAANNYVNSSRPRPGVHIPTPQPKPGPGWNCSTADRLYPNCSVISHDYILDGSPYVPPPLPSDIDFSAPKNNRTATHYYVSTDGKGDCLSKDGACNISAAMKIEAASMVVHVGPGTHASVLIFVNSNDYLSFIGSGMDTTQMGTWHRFGIQTIPINEVAFTLYASFSMHDSNGTGSDLYFSQMTLVNRANISGNSSPHDPRYMVMFETNGDYCVLTCDSVKFVCEEDNKGMIVYMYRGQVYFANCIVSQWVCNATSFGIFFADLLTVFFFQNVSFINLTMGGSIITEAVRTYATYPRLEVFISKCVFRNITSTNEPKFSGVETADLKTFRNQSVVYSANYWNINRTVGIYSTLFSDINGVSGAFAAGALFFNLYQLNQRPNITNCTFEACTGRSGGAVFVMEGSQYFQRCVFRKNAHSGSFTFGASDISIKNNRSDSVYGYMYFSGSCSLSTQPRIQSESRGDKNRFLDTCLTAPSLWERNESDDSENNNDGGKDSQEEETGGWRVVVFIVVGAVCGVAVMAVIVGVLYGLMKRRSHRIEYETV